MAGLHHKVLKAAIDKYSYLVEENKNEDEIKAEISKDEKGFSDEAINEIFIALTKPEAKEEEVKSGSKYVVAKKFRDLQNWDLVHEVGETISGMSAERIKSLLDLELITQA